MWCRCKMLPDRHLTQRTMATWGGMQWRTCSLSIFTRYLVIRWSRSGFISSGKRRVGLRADVAHFLSTQPSVRPAFTQTQRSVVYLEIADLRLSADGLGCGTVGLICIQLLCTTRTRMWMHAKLKFSLPISFRAQVSSACHHNPEDLSYS